MKISPTRLWAAALAAIFLIAHLALLPPALEDLDSMNFALGVRDFDPSKHQPHPPGYPVFIALGKLSHAVWPSEAGSLSVWGAVFGALSVFAARGAVSKHRSAGSFRGAGGRDRRAMLATIVVVASPLFWFTALRPLSDMTGLGMALAAQACLASAFVAAANAGRCRSGGHRRVGPADCGRRAHRGSRRRRPHADDLADASAARRGAARSRRARRRRRAPRQRDDVFDRRAGVGGAAARRERRTRAVSRRASPVRRQSSSPASTSSSAIRRRGAWRSASSRRSSVPGRCRRSAGLWWRLPSPGLRCSRGGRRWPRRCCSWHTCRTRLPPRCSGVVQPLRAPDRACGRLPDGERAVSGWNESGGVRKRGDCRCVAGPRRCPRRRRTGTYPSPVVRRPSAISRSSWRAIPAAWSARISDSPASLETRDIGDDDPAVAGHARVDRACGVLARRRDGAGVVSRRIRRAATWS